MSWGEANKTQCSYGGVTLVTIISNDDYKNIPCNLWIDGHQTEIELTAVKRKRKLLPFKN